MGVKFKGMKDPRAKKPKSWDDSEDGPWEHPVLKDKTADALAVWLRSEGVDMPAIGTIPDLDIIARAFMKEQKESLMSDAKKLIEKKYSKAFSKEEEQAKVKHYINPMEKVIDKGAEYVE